MNKENRGGWRLRLAIHRMVCTSAVWIVLGGTAHAQSSVTLYGVADAGLSYTSNAGGAPQYAMTTGNENGTRWGMRGSEDLGGGLKAIFDLEGGYDITNGKLFQNGDEFGRNAYVGFESSYGTLTLGRQYTSSSNIVGPFIAGGNWAAGGAGYGAHPGDVDNLDAFNEIDNAVQFQSNSYGGFTFGGDYSFGGKAGSFAQNQVYDIVAAYTHGGFAAAVGYTYAKNPNFSFNGNEANSSTTGTNFFSAITGGYASAGSQQIVAAGASYNLGPATLGVEYSNVRFNNLGATSVAGLSATEAAYRGSASFNVGEVNLKYYVTPSLMVGTAYSYTHDSGASGSSGAHYNQFDLGAVYSLSRATSLYLMGFYQAASGTNSEGVAAVAEIAGASTSASNRQTVVTAGILHKF